MGSPNLDQTSLLREELATNFLLDFVSPQKQNDFLEFKAEHDGDIYSSSVVAVFITIGLILFSILATTAFPNALTYFISILFLVSVIVLLWSVVFMKRKGPGPAQMRHKSTFLVVENLFLVAFCLGADFVMVMRVLNGSCSDLNFARIWGCNPFFVARGLPGDSVLFLTFLPLMCFLTLPFVSKKLIVAMYVLQAGFMIWAFVHEQSTSSLVFYILSLILSLSIFAIYSSTQCELFKYFVRTQALQQQREEILRLKTEEMKNVLGKIAHDLKTVSDNF